jgi:N-acetylmuramoyl-L-alanine amidase
MKRNVTLVLAVALLISAPAWAANPFGQFGGKVGGGNSGAGLLPLFGWALDDDGVEAVDILVDGVVDGRSNYHRSRPQVTKKYPGYPDSNLPGWVYQLDTTHYLNGIHTITARVLSKSGELVSLKSQKFQFGNVTHALDPFGAIEFPKHQAELRGHCNLADASRRWSIVSGYALDAGVQPEDTGVGYVELLLDGSLFANSNRDCFRLTDFNLPVNCYGQRRQDLVAIFPHLKDAPHSGFRFALDVGFLVSFFGYSEGSHRLTIRAGDVFEQVSTVDDVEVTFSCDDLDPADDEESIGDIEQPLDGNMFSGIMQLRGWALDWEGVQRVEVFVDGADVGTASYGHVRPLITPVYPGYPDAAAPGWEHSFDTTDFSNGEHFLEVVVTDDLGHDTYIGRRRFVIANPR